MSREELENVVDIYVRAYPSRNSIALMSDVLAACHSIKLIGEVDYDAFAAIQAPETFQDRPEALAFFARLVSVVMGWHINV